MGRRVTTGVVGGSGLGSINVTSNTITTVSTDQDLIIDPNGNGLTQFVGDIAITNQGDLRLLESTGNGSNYISMQAASAMSANYTLTWPASATAVNGYALTSDTSGNLSWAAAGAALTDNNSDSGTNYLTFTTSTSGFLTAARVATTTRALTYQPSTGTFTATILVESSAARLKENLNPIENALDKILQLQAFTYDRKDGSIKNEAGLIAEQVNEVIPNIVQKDENGNPVSIAYQRLTAYLIESIKELKQEIEILKVK